MQGCPGAVLCSTQICRVGWTADILTNANYAFQLDHQTICKIITDIFRNLDFWPGLSHFVRLATFCLDLSKSAPGGTRSWFISSNQKKQQNGGSTVESI